MEERGKVNILLVDDQPSKLLSYEAILEEMGENLIKVTSGREALKELMTRDIAVVLLDVIMPEMDGFELATLIREHPRFRRTAIILVSAIALSDLDRLRGYDSGAVDYVPVPIVPEVLRAKVAIFVELYRKSEALRRLNSELESRVGERTRELEQSTARLRESEERLRIALDTGRLGAWELDLESGRLEMTALCSEILGLPGRLQIDRETFMQTVLSQDRESLCGAIDAAIDEQSEFEIEYRCLWPDGSVHWLISRARILCNDSRSPVRLLGVTHDITERRRAEEERALLLESERAARMDAEKAVKIKDEFLATLSHELRTPLNAILGWSQLIRRSPADTDSVAQGLERIERNAREQARLIEDLLSVSRITSGKIRLDARPFDLVTTVRAAFDSIEPAARAKGLQLTLDAPADLPLVNGDSGRLQQVAANLLSNSLKFTPRGGSIGVSLRKHGAHIECEVCDTGEGIAPDFLPFVFERFRQADSSTTRQYGGLGLGLSIAKHIVEMHGGAIRAFSDGKGKGARFLVRLPAYYGSHVNADKPATNLGGARFDGVKILVVDDDHDSCELLERLLSEYGAEVRTTRSADQALQELQAAKFDLLLSDIGMAGTDGYDLIRQVRRLSAPCREIPAVAVTAFVRAEDRARTLDVGYDDHVPKPINTNQLVASISKFVMLSARNPAQPAPVPT